MLFLLLIVAVQSDLQNEIVKFSDGQVLGSLDGGVRSFFAVPFAAPTGGEGMFAPPHARDPWDFVMDCTTWGAGCFQSHHNPDVPKNQSMDCLNVNIFAPVLAPGTAASVMVFFNGGAFMEGSNQGPFGMYGGAHLALSQGVVVVSANYRLGAFGYLATNREGVHGSFGFMDQVAALRWVQENIHVVGGNASDVTVFGESAGAMSVGLLLATGRGEGLFHKAIMESNVAGFNYKNLSEAAVYADTFCGLLNCTDCALSCLRASPVESILDAWNTATGDVGDFILTNLRHVLDGFLDTGPTRDGVLIPLEPLAAVESGSYWGARVPLLLGTNTNEGETFIFDGLDSPLPPFLAEAAYLGIFQDLNITQRIQQQPRYHYQSFNDARIPLSNVITDYWFRCASEKFVAGAYAAGSPAWAYRFNHLYSNASIFHTFGLPVICSTAVCHASELPFVFQNVPNFTTFTDAELLLSKQMEAAWGNFAKTGNPNGPGAPNWPPWEPSSRLTLVLNDTMQTESTASLCGFWDSVGGYFS